MSGFWNCGCNGFIVVCVDDMCRGVGHCIHGDGEVICPYCLNDDLYDDETDESAALSQPATQQGEK